MRSNGQLLRVLGLGFGLATVVGGMVGQGILRTPGIVAGAVHSPKLIMLLWFIGALYTGISAFAAVEMGAAIPCAGGPFVFVGRAFGRIAGSVTGWASWLMGITSIAMLSVVVAEFLHRLGVLPAISTTVIAPGVIGLFWAVNWTGTRVSGASQMIFSALKGAALLALVCLLLAQPGSSSIGADISTPLGIAAFATGLRVIISTYNGSADLVYMCEEVTSPHKTLPKAVFSGILFVAILYLLINWALLHVLSPERMAQSNLPAADAAAVALGTSGDFVLTLFGVLSVGAITNLKLMCYPRVAFAMARGGQLPSFIAQVSHTGTPRVALTMTALFASAFAASGTYTSLIAVNVAIAVLLAIIVNASAIGLRQREPELARPFRIPAYPVPILVAIAVNVLLLGALVYEDPLHSLEGIALLAGIAVFYITAGAIQQRARVRLTPAP